MSLFQMKKCSKVTFPPQVKGNQWQSSEQNSALQSETTTLPPANTIVVLALPRSKMLVGKL